jgi:hypothetical protein
MTDNKCAVRANGDHCFHATDNPFQLIGGGFGAALLTMCCWCSPAHVRLNVTLDPRVSDEDLAVHQMTHGPRVLVDRQQRAPAPKIARLNGR